MPEKAKWPLLPITFGGGWCWGYIAGTPVPELMGAFMAMAGLVGLISMILLLPTNKNKS